MPYEKIGEGEPVCIADEVPFEIPESWEWVRLSFLGEIVGGGTPKTSDRESWANATIPWLTPADMKYVTGKYVSHGERAISEYGLAHSSAQLMPAGSILYSSRAPIGYIAISGNSICTNQGFKSLVPVIPDLNDYLYYCLITLTPSIQARASGTTFKEISRTEFGKTLIPIPPLKEQKRIVTKIEDAMPGVEQYSERANTLTRLNHDFPDSLKKSILQWAVQGKLVPQDPNDEPASVLLERIRAEKGHLIRKGKIKRDKHESVIFRRDNSYYEKVDGIERCIDAEIPFDVPDSWEWIRLGTVCEVVRGGSPRPIKQFLTDSDEGINWIKISDSDKGGKYISSTKEKIIPEGISKSRIVHAGDFLLTNSMSFGRPYILKIDGCIHDGWLVLSGYEIAYYKDFLYHMISASFAYCQFCGVVSGAVVKNLNSDKVSYALFPLPPLAEQKRIVEKIESILPHIEAM
ncbi:MAG: restriction endonuclease subunit S [Marvinbryantia sp.]|uniref:restriction endonuclease subunit S n=1 Tax=Marvinbryantia sp. TaxID=2496532 RepID=UPI00261B75A3|nr:restriction endonuclease subunit S [uncultured Marvinbryantia sp.]